MVVDVAGDEIGNHLQRNIIHDVSPGIEDVAGDGLIVGDGVLPVFVFLAAVKLLVGSEHAHELADGFICHAAVVPGGGCESRAAQALKPAVEPVHDSEVSLAHPAVAHGSRKEGEGIVARKDVGHHMNVVVKPDHMEIVHGVLEAAPLAVLIEAGVADVEVAEPSLLVGLAVPEIPGGLFDVKSPCLLTD